MVKEALFNALAARLAGSRVLDLFAGAGTLGIEALSRGAREAVFVERDPRGAAVIHENLRAARLADLATVRRADALSEIARLDRAGEQFDVVVLDPPYGRGLQAQALRLLARSRVLASGGVAVAEGHWRDDPGQVEGLRRAREARHGETALWFYEPAIDDGGTASAKDVSGASGGVSDRAYGGGPASTRDVSSATDGSAG
jgi:16S rRNA (guanine966-N2)-methyltransferase